MKIEEEKEALLYRSLLIYIVQLRLIILAYIRQG